MPELEQNKETVLALYDPPSTRGNRKRPLRGQALRSTPPTRSPASSSPPPGAPECAWAGFHTLRHTCATILFRHGANAKQVQMWLGHHSPSFTLATYVHLLPDDLPEPDFLDGLTATPGETETGAIEVRAPNKVVSSDEVPEARIAVASPT